MGVGDEKFFSITVRETVKNKFSVVTKDQDKKSETEVDMPGLLKVIKAHEGLKFVSDYLSSERGQYGRRYKSKKAKKSRKGSKKSSRRRRRRSRKSQKGGDVQVGGRKRRSRRSRKSKK